MSIFGIGGLLFNAEKSKLEYELKMYQGLVEKTASEVELEYLNGKITAITAELEAMVKIHATD